MRYVLLFVLLLSWPGLSIAASRTTHLKIDKKHQTSCDVPCVAFWAADDVGHLLISADQDSAVADTVYQTLRLEVVGVRLSATQALRICSWVNRHGFPTETTDWLVDYLRRQTFELEPRGGTNRLEWFHQRWVGGRRQFRDGLGPYQQTAWEDDTADPREY